MMTDSSFDFSRMLQTVLKMDSEMIHCQVLSCDISPVLLESWERLIDIVAQLLSPDSGWPDELPPTPENLATYITEEADEVLSIIHREIFNGKELSSTELSHYLKLEQLLPRLLWNLARSSDDIMRLLAGIDAQIIPKDAELQSGSLRLSAILSLNNRADWSIDLVTNHLPQSTLSGHTLIASLEGFVITEPIFCSDLLVGLREKILKVNPQLQKFFALNSTQFLEPGFAWNSGSFQIKFACQFLPSLELSEMKPSPVKNVDSFLDARVKLTNQALLEAYFESMMKQQLIQGIIDVLNSGYLQDFDQDLGSVNPAIFCLIEAAYEFVEAIHNPDKFDQLNGLGQEMLMKDLTHKLLWQIVRVHREIMQWIGGVKVSVLQPDSQWLKGILRLTLIFQIEMSENIVKIDVVTGELLSPALVETDLENSLTKIIPDKNAMIQLESSSEMMSNPIDAEHFLQKIQEQLETVSPELALWFGGTEIDFHLPEPRNTVSQRNRVSETGVLEELDNDITYTSWDSGMSQLQLGLELTVI